MRRKIARSRKRQQSTVLHVNVWNLRIAWFAALKLAFRTARWACVVAVIGSVVWGIKLGLEHSLYQNPDFRLQTIDLNANEAVDEADIRRIAEIDPSSNLFQLDLKEISARLSSQPELEKVHLERHLPGKLVVRVTARKPDVWIACPDLGVPPERVAGGFLADAQDRIFPCPEGMVGSAASLPMIVLPAREGLRIVSGEVLRHPGLVHCRRLLVAARQADPSATQWIDRVRQPNDWSLELATMDGTVATFGITDHARQVSNLLAAREHALGRGYNIATINLIPKRNVPITLASESRAQRLAAGEGAPLLPPASTPPVAIPVELEESAPSREGTAPVAARATVAEVEDATEKDGLRTTAVPAASPDAIPVAVPVELSGDDAPQRQSDAPSNASARSRGPVAAVGVGATSRAPVASNRSATTSSTRPSAPVARQAPPPRAVPVGEPPPPKAIPVDE